jgi:hypothetical protein
VFDWKNHFKTARLPDEKSSRSTIFQTKEGVNHGEEAGLKKEEESCEEEEAHHLLTKKAAKKK